MTPKPQPKPKTKPKSKAEPKSPSPEKEKRITKAERARQYLRRYPLATSTQFTEETGVKIATSQWSEVRKEVNNGTVRGNKALAALKAENEYLRWWVNGERRGWIDRMLKELTLQPRKS